MSKKQNQKIGAPLSVADACYDGMGGTGLKYLYFHDHTENLELEVECIKKRLQEKTGLQPEIETTDIPPFDDKYYDVLFFDWGGMSIGNSMLEKFCEYIVNQAEEKPNRIYIMTSLFTRDAMKDVLSRYEENSIPKNVFLEINDTCAEILREWGKS